MKNCLVTTYKVSVNDDNLSRLGCLRIDFGGEIDYSDNYVNIKTEDTFDSTVVEWLGGSSHPIIKYPQIIAINKTENVYDTLIIKPKYNISSIECGLSNAKVNLRELRGLSALKTIDLGVYNDDNINDLPSDLPLEIISFSYLSGNIDYLSNYPKLKNIRLAFYKKDLSPSRIEGKLFDISNLLELENIIVPVNISGTISDLRCYNTLKSFRRENNIGGVDANASLWANKFTALYNVVDWTTSVTWNSPTLRNSEYCLICGQIKFATSSDTDNYLINMASCLDNGLYPSNASKNYYLQNSHRTSTSDAAVQKLTAAGFTLNDLIVD